VSSEDPGPKRWALSPSIEGGYFMIMNEGATKHKLLIDCEYHDEKNKFIVERMMDVRRDRI
jgi:hypothetical protein